MLCCILETACFTPKNPENARITSSTSQGDTEESNTTDTTAPTVTGVTSSTVDGSYGIGVVIGILVNFSEPVAVTGTPTITLETGPTDQVVAYSSGSTTSTLTFNYIVQLGDISADLDYLSTTALALGGGSIRDVTDNAADLTLATPGATNSLGANQAIRIVESTEIKRTASDGTASDNFGRSVSVSGNIVVVGADLADVGAADQGSAYLYQYNPSTSVWDETKLTASDGTANDNFGNSVSVSGNTVIVGADSDDVGGTDQGSAYLYPAP